MCTFRSRSLVLSAALTLWTVAAAAQEPVRIVVGSTVVREHVRIGAAEHVSLEALLGHLGFQWSVRGTVVVVREGTARGPRITVDEPVLRVGDRSLTVTGVRRRDGLYVSLEPVLAHLGFRTEPDATGRTLSIVAGRVGDAARVRVPSDRVPGPGPAPGPPAGVGVQPGAVAALATAATPMVTLQVEGPQPGPDVPSPWLRTRTIDHAGMVRFRWPHHDPDAVAGRWSVRREGSWNAPVQGSTGGVPAEGSQRLFAIDFGQFAPATPPSQPIAYVVEVEGLSRNGQPTGATTTPVRVVYQASSQPPVTLLDHPDHSWRTFELRVDSLSYIDEDDDLSSDEPYLILVRFRFRADITPQGQATLVPGTLQVGHVGSSTHENLRSAQNWTREGMVFPLQDRGLRISEQVPTEQPGWVVGMVVVFMEQDGWPRSTAMHLRDQLVTQVRTSLSSLSFTTDATVLTDAVVNRITGDIVTAVRNVRIGELIRGLISAVDPDDFGSVNVMMAATMPGGAVQMFAGQPPADPAALLAGLRPVGAGGERVTFFCHQSGPSDVPGNARFQGICRIRGTVTAGLQ
jgi:hypothetical protein